MSIAVVTGIGPEAGQELGTPDSYCLGVGLELFNRAVDFGQRLFVFLVDQDHDRIRILFIRCENVFGE